MAAIALLSLMLSGCGSDSASPSAQASGPTPTTATPTPLVVTIHDIEAAGATRLQQGGDWLQVAGRSAWIAADDGVVQLDGANGARLALVPASGICTAMDVGFDKLWIADCDAGTIAAIDPTTSRLARTYSLKGLIAAPEGSVGAGEGGVWVATDASSLVRVDPVSGAVTTYPLPAAGAGVRAGLGSVWVTVPSAGQVLRIDPKDGSVLATIPAGTEPRFLTIGGDSVWVQNNGDGTVTRIGADGVVKATIVVSTTGINGGDIAFGGGYVWPRISAALIAKLDGTTGDLLASYGPPNGSGSVAADADAVWVSAHDVTAVWRLPLD